MRSGNAGLYIPKQSDIIWLNFTPQSGREQAGRRPALVLSPSRYNGKVGLVLVCPITSKVKGYPFEVPIPEELAISGVVLSDQMKSLDWRSRQAEFICKMPNDVTITVIKTIATLFPLF